MQFESRVFTLAKDAEHPEENQDVCRIDAGRAGAAIADGVASAIFSRLWAEILTEAVVADPPDPNDQTALAQWLAERRAAWEAQIDVTRLAWFQKPKLREGAFSTLLWVRLPSTASAEEEDSQAPKTCRLRGFAVGDSCLFWVREGDVLCTFPVQAAEELEADPVVLGSVDLNRDGLLAFSSLDEECRAGDLLVLSTDAVAEWVLKRLESGDPPRWDAYWEMTEPAWREEVAGLRRERHMRHDDATLVLLRVCERAAAVEELPEEIAPTTESPEIARPADVPSLPAALFEGDWRGDWRDRLKSLSGELADQVSEQVARGMKKVKKAKASAEAAVRRYRDRFRDDNQP